MYWKEYILKCYVNVYVFNCGMLVKEGSFSLQSFMGIFLRDFTMSCLCSTNWCEISLNCTCRLYIYRIIFAMWLNVKSMVPGKREGTFHLFMNVICNIIRSFVQFCFVKQFVYILCLNYPNVKWLLLLLLSIID